VMDPRAPPKNAEHDWSHHRSGAKDQEMPIRSAVCQIHHASLWIRGKGLNSRNLAFLIPLPILKREEYNAFSVYHLMMSADPCELFPWKSRSSAEGKRMTRLMDVAEVIRSKNRPLRVDLDIISRLENVQGILTT